MSQNPKLTNTPVPLVTEEVESPEKDSNTIATPVMEADGYEEASPLDWAEYELATVYYDYQIPLDAQFAIDDLVKRLCDQIPSNRR